jgi:hypothetical protein
MEEWKISYAWTSNEGSSGVVFVLIQQDEQDEQVAPGTDRINRASAAELVYVIKSSSRIAEELFANKS